MAYIYDNKSNILNPICESTSMCIYVYVYLTFKSMYEFVTKRAKKKKQKTKNL